MWSVPAQGFYARLVIPIKRTPQVVQAPSESETYGPLYAASNNLTFEKACWRHFGLEAPVSHMTQVRTQLWIERQRQRRPVALLAPLRGQETHAVRLEFWRAIEKLDVKLAIVSLRSLLTFASSSSFSFSFSFSSLFSIARSETFSATS